MNRTPCRKQAGGSFRSRIRRMNGWRTAAMAACLGVLVGPPLAAQAPEPPPEAELYRIAPGDRLELFVWKEPDLTRELLVRTDGLVTVPLIGDVEAGGSSTAELAAAIERRLAQYVNSPNVTVGLKTGRTAQFFVVGKVSKPGAYPLEKPTTFLQALALAGGFVEFAKTDHVLVYREEDGKVDSVNFKKLVDGDDDSAENVPLRAGDTIVVP